MSELPTLQPGSSLKLSTHLRYTSADKPDNFLTVGPAIWAIIFFYSLKEHLSKLEWGINPHFYCAQNRNRTCTFRRKLVPETSASTNSAIWAIIFSYSLKNILASNPSPDIYLMHPRCRNCQPCNLAPP